MRRIVEPLQSMGVAIHSSQDCAPLTIEPSPFPLRPVNHTLDVASAQVKSCLLLAGLAAAGSTVVHEPGPSRDHTERMLRSMGARVESSQTPDGQYATLLVLPAGTELAPLDMTLPGDISAAAFLIVAALITPASKLTLCGVGLNPTRIGLLDALRSMGAQIEISNHSEEGGEPTGDLLVSSSSLSGIQVGGDLVVRMIDEFPVFAVAAACAQGRTVVRNAQELRYKESDRIAALGLEIRKLGVNFQETPDGFIIDGGRRLCGASVDPHGDHRLAMALAVAGLVATEPVIVENAAIINESFPDFAGILQGLGAELENGA
jgi:3-phosphoshikimate 1-carboxyvinyltransferase